MMHEIRSLHRGTGVPPFHIHDSLGCEVSFPGFIGTIATITTGTPGLPLEINPRGGGGGGGHMGRFHP